MNAKCKKFLTMLLLVCVSIGAAGCSAYSNQRYYERAQLMMGSGEYAEAAELFHQLGEYEDSAEYAPTGICAIWMRWTRKTRANSIPRWTSTSHWAALRTARSGRRRWKPRFRSKLSGRGGR